MTEDEKIKVLENMLKENGYKEIKVYNCFNVVSEDNPNNKKEKFTKESLVDPLEKVPTLQEYVKRYLVTGDPRVLPYNNDPVDEISDDEADDDFSSPLYDKDVDVEDLKSYHDSVVDALQKSEKYEQYKDGVQKDKDFINKLQKETTKESEKIEQPKELRDSQEETKE